MQKSHTEKDAETCTEHDTITMRKLATQSDANKNHAEIDTEKNWRNYAENGTDNDTETDTENKTENNGKPDTENNIENDTGNNIGIETEQRNKTRYRMR